MNTSELKLNQTTIALDPNFIADFSLPTFPHFADKFIALLLKHVLLALNLNRPATCGFRLPMLQIVL